MKLKELIDTLNNIYNENGNEDVRIWDDTLDDFVELLEVVEVLEAEDSFVELRSVTRSYVVAHNSRLF